MDVRKDRKTILKDALVTIEDLQSRLQTAEGAFKEPIAIVGMSLRFPGGANDAETFWALLHNGIDAIREVPSERWNIDSYYDPDPEAKGKVYTRYGGFLNEVDTFDANFFGIAPREAVSMDPQHRLLLETTWEALESSGLAPHRLIGTQTGVFVGITSNDYLHLVHRAGSARADVYRLTGNALNFAAGHIAYTLGLQGPTMAVDTACSSSLVAVHLASQSLRLRECNVALAGGVNLMLSPEMTINLCKARMLSPDGRCKTFDEAANGFVRGEGCAVIVLKRLSDALADNDNILAVMRGSAINQDGQSSGLTVPNRLAQEAVIRQALKSAGVEPTQVSYVEAHGTGTSLGDPIEVRALLSVYGRGCLPERPLAIGSLKTNIGHLESAAGIAGLIKAILALQNEEIPPHIHFKKLNPGISFSDVSVIIPTTPLPWARAEAPRVAGVSSFGASGTNVHVIVEEAPAREVVSAGSEHPLHVLCISAKSGAALTELARRYENHLAQHASTSLAETCSTANAGRSHFAHRLAIVAPSSIQAREKLAAFLAGREAPDILQGAAKGNHSTKVAFLFTGQGSQYVGMGRQLYERVPVFRAALDKCAELLRPYLDKALLSLLYPDDGAPSALDETAYTQPALFALEYALAELWKSWGIEPAAVLGHSVGEYVAACVAGVFSLEDGLKLIAERGRLMQALPRDGQMAVVFADKAQVAKVIAERGHEVSIAAINGPENVVVSGSGHGVKLALKTLEAQGINSTLLRVSHAFHSPLMEPILDAFERVVAGVVSAAPQIRLVSNVTGQPLAGDEAIQAAYWRRHVREPVNFFAGMRTLHELGCDLFVEIGPRPTLVAMGRRCLPETAGCWLPSLRQGRDDWQQMLETLAGLYTQGVDVDWLEFDGARRRRPVWLPTYPFQRQRFWVEAEPSHAVARESDSIGSHPFLSHCTSSPIVNDVIVESRLSTSLFGYLDDHCVQGLKVLPMTAHLELTLAATRSALPLGTYGLDDLEFREALLLSAEECTVQVVLTPDKDGGASFQLISVAAPLQGKTSSWKVHVTGRARRRASGVIADGKQSVLEMAKLHCREAIPAGVYYGQLWQSGLEFGSSFRGIEKLWRSDGESLGRIQAPAELEPELDRYEFHPALLDACLQVFAAARPIGREQAADHQTYLPFSLESYCCYKHPAGQVWSHARVRAGERKDADTYAGDISIFDADGFPVAEFKGLVLKRASADRLQSFAHENCDDWLYQTAWRPKPLAALATPSISSDDLPSPVQLAQHVRDQTSQANERGELSAYERLLPHLDALCSAYALRAFQQLGWHFSLCQRYTTASIARQLGVINKHRRLLDRLLDMLEEDGVLTRKSGEWEVCRVPELGNPKPSWQALVDNYPASAAELALLGSCGERLAEVLRGAYDPLQLLFPGGSVELLEKLYQHSPIMQAMNQLVRKAVAKAVANVPQDHTWRILEVGAGTGGTTASILSELPMDRTEYVFTDVSPLFLQRAAEKFRAYPFVRYQLLDLEHDPEAQRFGLHRFDLVIAANVVHATTDLRRTIEYVRKLLASQGLLLLVEGTDRERWVDLTFGLTEGWWKFTDMDLRPSYALLSRRNWMELLGELQFTDMQAAPAIDDGKRSTRALAQHAMILARGPRVEWSTDAKTGGVVPAEPRRNYAIFADKGGVGAKLADMLKARGQNCVFIAIGSAYEASDHAHFIIDPSRPQDFYRLFAEAFCNNDASCGGVVHLWNLDLPAPDGTNLEQLHNGHITGTASVLHLVQAVVKTLSTEPPRLWVVTRGTQPLGFESAPVEVVQSPIWGLGKVVALELPELHCTRIDLDPAAGPASSGSDDEIEQLFNEIWSSDKEDQIAFRGGARHVARLRLKSPSVTAVSRFMPRALDSSISHAPVQLKIATNGVLEGLKYEPMVRCGPGPGEVEIRVHATGLNFRDVLTALGMRPGDGGLLGSDCAGEIVSVGEGVLDFKVGDAVMGFAPGSFGSFVTTRAELIVDKPEHLSFEEAAAIPSVFVTAYCTLIHVGNLARGEKVLIHAAAGGVGLAAVQIAQRAGAEIFATAGSPKKREFLKSLGVQHVLHSRSVEFAREIIELTNGQGVDVVLNSLNGEFIPKSLSIMNEKGRFIEIGKREIWDEQRVAQFRKIAAYHVVDIEATTRDNPPYFGSMLREIVKRVNDGSLKPLPLRVFSSDDIVSAFRHMQQAKHIGKIVIVPEKPANRAPTIAQAGPNFSRDATYLITGGLGGLGLRTAQWMVEHGAGCLALMGRSAPTAEVSTALAAMKTRGARVVVFQGDVAREKDVVGVLMQIKGSLPPLRGIIHSVGVLDDGASLQQTWERFAKVLAPKVDGAWLLHQLTQDLLLDFFVLYSSMAALLGSRGQGNHAAANAFLDALAHHRRALGQPATSIQWGAWSEIGAAARESIGERMATHGIGTITPQRGLRALESIMAQDLTEIGVFPVDWSRYAQQFSTGGAPPFLAELTGEVPVAIRHASGATEPSLLLQQLANAPLSKRRHLLLEYARAQALRVLGLDSSHTIDPEQPLRELGLDSLMAVEMRNLLGFGLGLKRTLPATLLFDHPTVNAVVDYLANDVLEWREPAELQAVVPIDDGKQAADFAELERLSEEEAEALLIRELEAQTPRMRDL
jgi:acyl transferase domain-containing protein/NADPH:quinone reductase-like Zn-dependent oxidoreductase/NAD(P)-dependent dehydrogenase (short-subunit alcohol dehydrogenase family)/acyl carrier protein